MAINTLERVVASHTKKVVADARQAAIAQLTKLEKAAFASRKIDLGEPPTELDALFARFDPKAMTTVYQDEKLGLALPALFAFDLKSEKASRKVRLDNGIEFFGHPGSEERILNEHARPVWKAILKAEAAKDEPREKWSLLSVLSGVILIGTILLVISTPALLFEANRAELTSPPMLVVYGVASAALLGMFVSTSRLNRLPAPRAMRFTVAFDGVIPDHVRQTIARTEHHFSAMYLVCDVANAWSMEEVPRRINRDPLVIGEMKSAEGKTIYYLVDQFDLTPIEEHTIAEWTAKA